MYTTKQAMKALNCSEKHLKWLLSIKALTLATYHIKGMNFLNSEIEELTRPVKQ